MIQFSKHRIELSYSIKLATTFAMPQSSVGDQSLAQHDSMADILRVVWFCDDTPLQDKRRLFNTIQNQVKDKRFSLVALFLAHALTAVKQEVFNLDREGQRECVGSLVTFLDVLDVAETTSNGLGGAFHSFLQVVLDIALFIGYELRLVSMVIRFLTS